MSFDVSTGAVSAVLSEVKAQMPSYQTLMASFGEDIAALAQASKAEPVGTALQGASEKVFSPAINNVVGRTNVAVTAVNDVLAVLISADQSMSDTARDAAAKAAQGRADDAPPPLPAPASGKK